MPRAAKLSSVLIRATESNGAGDRYVYGMLAKTIAHTEDGASQRPPSPAIALHAAMKVDTLRTVFTMVKPRPATQL